MRYSLRNKTVFITGSSIGIGRETAYQFAAAGAKLVITYYLDKIEAAKAANYCLRLGAVDVLVVRLNMMSDISVKKAVRQIVEHFGEIDILINNAGVIVWKSLWEQSFENIEQQLRINLEGLMKLTKECLPYLKETIINVSSGAGLSGFEKLTTYCATKFGVRGFTKALAEELPELSVYCVNPGVTATRMTNFRGQPPREVAEIIFNTAKGEYGIKSGFDINVWEFSPPTSKRLIKDIVS